MPLSISNISYAPLCSLVVRLGRSRFWAAPRFNFEWRDGAYTQVRRKCWTQCTFLTLRST
ncbi:hypothetical protein M408DRAFT_227659 [Serendipita vermifera MAFF 305830]|uniref:Uncharacterized protein n=1 Tax=Serendipita vermifera MAFF 305830 TaxID=933852 RepID=A0A0C2WEI1_SERVB|nr:hypothetical protein M408DRAFT_227659 [Serendipita vermifera MAFF 305830]